MTFPRSSYDWKTRMTLNSNRIPIIEVSKMITQVARDK